MIFQGTECGRDILRQLRAGGGIDCVGANEMFNGMSTVRFHELSQFSNRASRRCNISFLMSLMSVNWPHTIHVTVFRRALNFYDKLFHQPKLVRVFFPEMLFANVSSLFLPVLSPKTHRRFKLALVNDCRDVSPLFRWQAYYRRQHLSRHLGVAVKWPFSF